MKEIKNISLLCVPLERSKKGMKFNMEILKVENLSKIYGKGETTVKAIDNISFSVSEGEFVAIIGPSGSRKIYNASHFRWC